METEKNTTIKSVGLELDDICAIRTTTGELIRIALSECCENDLARCRDDEDKLREHSRILSNVTALLEAIFDRFTNESKALETLIEKALHA